MRSEPTVSQSLPTQAPPQPQQTYNSIDLNFNGYNWTYSLRNDTRSDIFPCQGTCMDACTPDCNLDQDCCCCPDPNMIMPQPQVQPQLVSAPLTYPAAVSSQHFPDRCCKYDLRTSSQELMATWKSSLN